MRDRRGRYTEVDFPGLRFFYEVNERPGGRAADNGIIHDDNLLPLEHAPDNVELCLHLHLAVRLSGRDERPANVVAPYQSNLVSGLRRHRFRIYAAEAERCGVRGIRYVDDGNLAARFA